MLFSAAGTAAETDSLFASIKDDVPPRGEGQGQYDQLIIRGAYLIDGTGAPATGPVDVVVEDDRITQVTTVGTPGIAIDPKGRPPLLDGADLKTREIDAHGKYLLPGFVDSHTPVHAPDKRQKVSADYIFKLWLGHGVTSTREVFGSDGESRLLALKALSEKNAITAPRITAFPYFAMPADGD